MPNHTPPSSSSLVLVKHHLVPFMVPTMTVTCEFSPIGSQSLALCNFWTGNLERGGLAGGMSRCHWSDITVTTVICWGLEWLERRWRFEGIFGDFFSWEGEVGEGSIACYSVILVVSFAFVGPISSWFCKSIGYQILPEFRMVFNEDTARIK